MSDVIIKVENLNKVFKLYNHPKDRLKEALSPLRKKYHHEYHALKNIQFEVKRGESLGILGKNGAGKSTLLKILTGVLTPTSGIAKINGRIAALLELGSGFNPELSGMDNIYFQGAIIGFKKEEMENRISKIVEFADIGEFIHQPVKTYSSGMFARLAFSIAVNVEPDILIVDEALSVGDIKFQAKCMIHLKKMMKNGVTLLFVSHDPAAVKGLCTKCITIEKGCLIDFGDTVEVVDRYLGRSHLEINDILSPEVNPLQLKNKVLLNAIASNARAVNKNPNIIVSVEQETNWGKEVHRYGSNEGKILDIKLLDINRRPVDFLEVEQEFIIQASIRFESSFPTFCVGYSLRDLKGQQLVGGLTTSYVTAPSVNNGDVFVIEIQSKNKLKAGTYTVSLGLEMPVILNQNHLFLDIIENAITFQSKFSSDPNDWFSSIVKVSSTFKIEKIETN